MRNRTATVMLLLILAACSSKDGLRRRITFLENQMHSKPETAIALKKAYVDYCRRFADDTLYLHKTAAFLSKNDMVLEALSYYDKMLALHPADVAVRREKAFAFMKAFRYGDALNEYRRAVAQSPADSGLLRERRMVEAYDSIYKTVLSLDEKIRTNPVDTSLYLRRSRCFRNMGMPEASRFDLSNVLAVDSTFTDAYYLRSLIYLEQDSIDASLKELDLALQKKPGTEKYIRLRKQIEATMVMRAEVEKYSAQIRQNPSDSKAYLGRSRAYARYKQYVPALRDLDVARSLDPRDPNVYLFYTIICYRTGETAKAEESLATYKKLGGTISPELLNDLKKGDTK